MDLKPNWKLATRAHLVRSHRWRHARELFPPRTRWPLSLELRLDCVPSEPPGFDKQCSVSGTKAAYRPCACGYWIGLRDLLGLWNRIPGLSEFMDCDECVLE